MRFEVTAAGLALSAALTAAGVAAPGDPPATPATPAPGARLCADPPGPVAVGMAQWNGWGRDSENTRYQPEPALRAIDVHKLALKWAFGFEGSAVAGQPSVVDGRLFVASAVGRVYALDARTGCTYWTFDAGAGVHTPITIGEYAPPKSAAPTKATGAPTPRHKTRHHHRATKRAGPRTLAHTDLLKAPSTAFFGDDTGTVYALDAQSGALRWKVRIDAHPRARILGAPTVSHGRLYVVVGSARREDAPSPTPASAAVPTHAANEGVGADSGSRGSVVALDVVSGQVLWKTVMANAAIGATAVVSAASPSAGSAPAAASPVIDPAADGAPVMAAPSIDDAHGLLYVATDSARAPDLLDKAVVALDLNDGRVRWVKRLGGAPLPGAVPDLSGFTTSPILRHLPGERHVLVVTQRSGTVFGLDPDRGGELLWTARAGEGNFGGVEWGAAADHRSVYVPLSGLTEDPLLTEGRGAVGGLVALDLKTGARRWQVAAPTPACAWGPRSCSHAEAQAATLVPGAVFSGAMDGHLRAYSTIDGKILWDYATATDFVTVNGVKASGGSLDRGGPVIVDGMLYVNSGYGERVGQPGNVLLAFAVPGK